MDEKTKQANRALEGMVRAFNKVTKDALPIIKKQTAEGMMRGASKELKDLFMSRVDLS